MADEPSGKPKEILLFPCSGSSNVGQIANQAAVILTGEGIGSMFCIAGIGAHVESMIKAAKTAKRIVAINGCSTDCAKKTLEQAGITATDNIDVTKEGIAKSHNLKISEQDVKLIVRRIKQELKGPKI